MHRTYLKKINLAQQEINNMQIKITSLTLLLFYRTVGISFKKHKHTKQRNIYFMQNCRFDKELYTTLRNI